MVRNTRCARVGSSPTYSNLTFAGEGLRETCLASSQEKLGQFQPSAQSSDEAELPQYIVHKLRIDSEEHKNDEVSQAMK